MSYRALSQAGVQTRDRRQEAERLLEAALLTSPQRQRMEASSNGVVITRIGGYPWRKMRRSRAPSIAPGTFFAAQFSAGCTTNMSGFDLRKAQPSRRSDAASLQGSDDELQNFNDPSGGTLLGSILAGHKSGEDRV
jgi:hypothetical protein